MTTNTDIKEEAWVISLIKSIHEEIAAHQLLLNKLQAQQYAIVDRDVLRLFELNRETLDSKEKAKVAFDKRAHILKFGKEIRSSYEFDSIEKVIPLVKNEFSEKMMSQRQTLLRVVKEIKETNKVSKYLLDKSIEFVNHNLRLIKSQVEFGDSYDSNGYVEREPKGSALSQLR